MKGKNTRKDSKPKQYLCVCGKNKPRGKSRCKECKKGIKDMKISILMGKKIEDES